MSIVPAASLAIVRGNTSVDPVLGIARRMGISPTTGEVLSRCPIPALGGYAPTSGRAFTLPDGHFATEGEGVFNLYDADAVLLASVDTFVVYGHRYGLVGTDGASSYWVCYTTEADGERHVWGARMDPLTGAVTDDTDLGNVTVDKVIYVVAAGTVGRFWFIASDDADPEIAAHDLNFTLVPGGTPTLARTFGAGEEYPVPYTARMSVGLNSGHLLTYLQTWDLSSASLQLLNGGTGAAMVSYGVEAVPITVFEGETGETIWIVDGIPRKFRERQTTDDSAVVTLDPAAHNWEIATFYMPYILSVGYRACLGPPPDHVVRPIRRARVFPLPFDRSFYIYLWRIEFLIQAGMGQHSGQGSQPLIEVRFSGDGGTTWGDTITVEAGAEGEYEIRPVINRIGKLRNGVCEIAVSDPVFWYFLDCFVDVDENVT